MRSGLTNEVSGMDELTARTWQFYALLHTCILYFWILLFCILYLSVAKPAGKTAMSERWQKWLQYLLRTLSGSPIASPNEVVDTKPEE